MQSFNRLGLEIFRTRQPRRVPTVGTIQRRRLSTPALAMVVVLAASMFVVSGVSAAAAEYPTWAEVDAARASETAAKTLVAQIRTQLQTLTAEAQRTATIAETTGNEFQTADQKLQEAAFTATQLKAQADEANARAVKSRDKAGRMVALLSRAGGENLTGYLLANGSNAKDLLAQLGFASKVTDLAAEVYANATRERNSAQALNDQANVAKTRREQLRTIAEQALAEATAASAFADAAVAEQTQNQAELQAQLTVLTEKRTATERDYAAGEAARAAARAAASAGPAGIVSASGWANPTSGNLVSSFGYRIHPIYKTYRLHTGVDLAGGCNVPIYAATGGRVVFSGLNGGFGNFVLLDHGTGIQSAYAHIIDGGRLVANGQQVTAGQMIARTGSTGASTGCHLHFEIRSGGTTIDPVPFMQDRGVALG